MPLVLQTKKPVGGAYGRYVNEHRALIRDACMEKYNSVQGSLQAKMGSDMWKGATPSVVAEYQSKYNAAKARYDNDLADFLKAGGVQRPGVHAKLTAKRKAKERARQQKAGTAPKEKDHRLPKVPLNTYQLWLADRRADIQNDFPPNTKMSVICKRAGEIWKDLEASVKDPYIAKHKELMDGYRERKRTWQQLDEESESELDPRDYEGYEE